MKSKKKKKLYKAPISDRVDRASDLLLKRYTRIRFRSGQAKDYKNNIHSFLLDVQQSKSKVWSLHRVW